MSLLMAGIPALRSHLTPIKCNLLLCTYVSPPPLYIKGIGENRIFENDEKYTIFRHLNFINSKNVAPIRKNLIFATKKY